MKLLLFLVPFSCFATHYYVAAAGSDSNPGTSPGSPWQTTTKVNAGTYNPGDIISFNGGDTFTGTLTPTLAGSAGNVITVNSYGTGNGIISIGSGVTHGFNLTNPQYLTITGLTITGAGWTGSGLSITVLNGGTGILMNSTNVSGPLMQSVTISHCVISGFFTGVGIYANGSASTVGFNNLLVTGNTLSGNLSFGVLIQGFEPNAGGPTNQLTNISVTNNIVQNLPGDPNSGSGGVHGSVKTEASAIDIANVTGGAISGNLLTDVGGFGGAISGLTLGGSTAAVFSNSTHVSINSNEIARTKCSTHFDGSAIDFDQDTTNAEAAYNLTYNNVGPAVQWGSYGGPITSGIRVHHNFSYNDARGNNTGGTSEQGAIRLWGNTANSQVFNNTVYVGSGSVGIPSGINFEIGSNSTVLILNNVFKVTGGIGALWANTTNNPTNLGTPTVIGNVYDPSGGSLLISNNNGSSAQNITSLATWRGLGYEVFSAVNYGSSSPSLLANLAGFSPPSGGFIGAGFAVSWANGMDLGPGSSAIAEGFNPSLVGVSIGSQDYHGNSPTRAGGIIDAGSASYLPSSSIMRGTSSLTGTGTLH